MSIHDGLNHQCSICGHTSKSRDALRKHLAYRHLIGMSGPVRPRMPANKRRKDSVLDNTSSRSAEVPVTSGTFSDNELSTGEDQKENPSSVDTW